MALDSGAAAHGGGSGRRAGAVALGLHPGWPCSSRRSRPRGRRRGRLLGPGQTATSEQVLRLVSRSTRPRPKMFTVRNESKADAVVLVTFVVPGGTPTTVCGPTGRSRRPAPSEPPRRSCERPAGARSRRGPLDRTWRAALPASADGDPASDQTSAAERLLPYRLPSASARSALAPRSGRRLRPWRSGQGRPDLRPDPPLGQSRRPSESLSSTRTFWASNSGSGRSGPLLVVMPAGFGVYDGGRSTAPED